MKQTPIFPCDCELLHQLDTFPFFLRFFSATSVIEITQKMQIMYSVSCLFCACTFTKPINT